MEAIQIALYGKKGFDYLYPKMSFEDWLEAAYSVDGRETGTSCLHWRWRTQY